MKRPLIRLNLYRTARAFARCKDFKRDNEGETTKETKDAKENASRKHSRKKWPANLMSAVVGAGDRRWYFRVFCFRVFRVFRGSLRPDA
jgi:hypothetical protein